MPALVRSFTLVGIEAVPVEVQVSADSGYPVSTLVGLPDKAVRESLDRVYAAFASAGFAKPDRRITINLAPAELRKEGSALDLPIALGILAATEAIPSAPLERLAVAGELALDGTVRRVRGALAMALACARAGGHALVIPAANLAEAGSIPGVRVVPVRSLAEVTAAFREGSVGESSTDPVCAPAGAPGSRRRAAATAVVPDLADIHGQIAAKRALEIAAAGGHNLLLVGPPGAGKTLLAQRLPGILPQLGQRESLDVTLVYSAAGLLAEGVARVERRPFRAPHHTITGPGLVGGGAIPRPGEVTLAHRGVLFLDELPEFRPQVLNLLRQPIEEGSVHLVRVGRTVRFPCRFMLLGAMNPCPCGFLGHPKRACRCTPHQVKSYRGRLSGPLLDRIDMHIEVPSVPARELMRKLGRDPGLDLGGDLRQRCGGERAAEGKPPTVAQPDLRPALDDEPSAAVRARVEAARAVQIHRFAARSGIHCNAQMGLPEIDAYCRIDAPTRAFLQQAIESLAMSARAAHRALRVARTIADHTGAEAILLEHVAEAVQYQVLERGQGEDH